MYLDAMHLVVAFLWAGGSSFLLLVVIPAGRTTMPLPERALYFRRLDRSFDGLVYAAVTLLFFTGVLSALTTGRLGSASRRYLIVLAVKTGLVVAMLMFRVFRSARRGPGLARAAAEALRSTQPSWELDRLWRRSILLLSLEVLFAVPVTLLGLLLHLSG